MLYEVITDVKKLIAGPTVYICDECVDICLDIIAGPAGTGSQMTPVQTAAAAGGESFAALFEESLTRKEMRVGEVITSYNFV